MREGKPSPRFGARGFHNICLGGGSNPFLAKLYGPNDEVLATLTEERGECIDPGYVDFFLGPNCRPAKFHYYLVEKLPDGTTGVLHDNPKKLAADFDGWVTFLDAWIAKHERNSKQLAIAEQASACCAMSVNVQKPLVDAFIRGTWRWEHRATDAGKHVATLLVTDQRPVPCNDPVIFALREDWMGKLSPEREAAKKLLSASPMLLEALLDALPYVEDVLNDPVQLGCFKSGVVQKHAAAIRKAIEMATGPGFKNG